MRFAIVDGYSTGSALVKVLRQEGAACIHVQSHRTVPDYFRRGFCPEDYEVDLGYMADRSRLAAALAGLGVTRVVAGTESGVILADELGAAAGLPGNDPGTAPGRRDKRLTAAAARFAGIPVPAGRAFTDGAEAAAWFTSARLGEAVVKPPASAGTDHVRFCDTADSVRAACEAILASANLYGDPNEAAIVQERLQGTEYYLNTVSHGGVHRVAEAWEYTKAVGPGGSPVYDFERPLVMDSPRAAGLRRFVFAALDALGVESSAAHTEVILTGRGPVLVESGARLGGATIPWVVEKYSGVSQTSLFAAALLDPARLEAFDDLSPRWAGTVRNVAFMNRATGRVRSLGWLDVVSALPTAVAVASSVEAGARLEPTVDLIGSPGFVYLAADDPSDVRRDYERLRALERSNLYTT